MVVLVLSNPEHGHTLAGLITSGDFSDVTLVTKDKIEVKAHKLILSAFSPFFQEQFKHTKTARIDLDEVTFEAVSPLLRFMYSGRCEVEAGALATTLQVVGCQGQGAETKNLTKSSKQNKRLRFT